jgi:hypothetical protein
LDLPAEFVPIVDIEFSTDTSGNIRLIPRYLALGVDAFTAHTQPRWFAYLNTSVPTHYFAYLIDRGSEESIESAVRVDEFILYA